MEDCHWLIFIELGAKARAISKKYKTLADNYHKFIELFRLGNSYNIIEKEDYWCYSINFSSCGASCSCFKHWDKDRYPVGINPYFIDV